MTHLIYFGIIMFTLTPCIIYILALRRNHKMLIETMEAVFQTEQELFNKAETLYNTLASTSYIIQTLSENQEAQNMIKKISKVLKENNPATVEF